MSKSFPVVRLGDVLIPVSRSETVVAEKTYHILGAHWYAKGLYTKDIKSGSQIQAKNLYRAEQGDFVYNRLFAWKGSFAVASEKNHGCYVSNEFPCFLVNQDRIDSRYLWGYFSRAGIWEEAFGLSTGGTPTSRNRLKEDKLLAMKMPLPPVEEQRRIVAKIDKIAAKIEEVYGLRRENVVESNMLLYAGLREVFCSRNAQKLLGDALELHRGFDLPVQQRIPGPYPVFAANGEIGRHAESRVKGPGVCTGRSGSVGAVNYVEEDFWPLNTALYVSDFKGNNPRLIYYLLLSVSFDLKKISTHTAVPTLDRKKAHSQIKVHIPPLPEQGQIVAHLDGLADKVDALNHLQTETAAEIGALLPSILDKAFKGEL